MSISNPLDKAIYEFSQTYQERLGKISIQTSTLYDGFRHDIESQALRGKGNYPFILSHGRHTNHVVVLTHGLSDSPYYMEAIGKRFFKTGANVLCPLLYGHGMKFPDKALQDWYLSEKWKQNMDQIISNAILFGDTITLGGFSTGGTLSLNALLRHENKINGGLFLFSAALDIGFLHGNARKIPLLQSIYRLKQEKIVGEGPNPYKYPVFSNFSGLQLSNIIHENNRQLYKKRIRQPVFAAHSVQDPHTLLIGITHLLGHHVENGVAYLIAQCTNGHSVEHGEVVLEQPIHFSPDHPFSVLPPKANPKFDEMMVAAIQFFNNNVQS
jgi:pimeloyl-ACP methyl ester carboxylesterase